MNSIELVLNEGFYKILKQTIKYYNSYSIFDNLQLIFW